MLVTNCLFLLALPHDLGSKMGGELKRTLQHIQTDAAQLINVWVIDLGEKSDFWRSHRVVVWQKELKLEYAR